MPDNGLFFIVGSGRSGSTLLRLLLSSHPRIHIPPETWFIIPLTEQLPSDKPLSVAQVRKAVEIITSHYRWPDMGIKASDLEQSCATLDAPMLRGIIDLVYDRLLESSGKARLGDKTPPYISIIPRLAVLYPGARFIHLIRDGRDVAISYIELSYECRFYDGKRFDWIASMDKAREFRHSRYAGRVLEVRYENLVANRERTLREICAFLGEAFDPRMIEARPGLEAIPERERHIHAKLARPIGSESVGIWRHKLSGIECFLMEACLREYLGEFGYPLRYRAMAWQPVLFATGKMLGIAAPLLDRAIPYLRRRNLFPKNFYF